MNKKQIVYLSEPIKDEKDYINDHNKHFYSYFGIPKNLENAFHRGWPEKYDKLYDMGYIEYFCPNCNAQIRAEWIFPADKIKVKDKFKTDKTVKDLLSKIEKNYSDYLSKSFNIISLAGNLKKCPVCNSELRKDVPFVDHILMNYGEYPDKCKKSLEWAKDQYIEDYYEAWSDYRYELLASDEQITPLSYDDYRLMKLRTGIDNELSKSSQQKADDFIKICENQSISCQNNVADANIDFLKKYLANLINLESNILFLSQRLRQLYFINDKNDRDVYFDLNILAYERNVEIKRRIKSKESLLEIALIDLDKEKEAQVVFEKLKEPSPPEKPVPLKANIFNKKKIESQNAQALAEYEKALEIFNASLIEIKEKNEQRKISAEEKKKNKVLQLSQIINKYKEEILEEQNKLEKSKTVKTNELPIPSLGKKQIINDEISLLEEVLKNTYKCRNEMYSCNVVFDKYRNIVALTTFYEYLMAGRCESLDGVNGAYNIYENEIRLDTIISQLDEIKTRLDEIKQNQYMIYKTMKDIESSLKRLNASMDKAVKSLDSIDTKATTMNNYLANISQNSEVIAHNAAVSAYYSKKNAELTNALGFMVAYK